MNRSAVLQCGNIQCRVSRNLVFRFEILQHPLFNVLVLLQIQRNTGSSARGIDRACIFACSREKERGWNHHSRCRKNGQGASDGRHLPRFQSAGVPWAVSEITRSFLGRSLRPIRSCLDLRHVAAPCPAFRVVSLPAQQTAYCERMLQRVQTETHAYLSGHEIRAVQPQPPAARV